MKKPKALQIYEALCPNDTILNDDPRRGDIIQEMLQLKRLPLKEAADLIKWWGWDSTEQLNAFVKKAKARWAK